MYEGKSTLFTCEMLSSNWQSGLRDYLFVYTCLSYMCIVCLSLSSLPTAEVAPLAAVVSPTAVGSAQGREVVAIARTLEVSLVTVATPLPTTTRTCEL